MLENFIPKTDAVADERATVIVNDVKITVLFDKLIRIEKGAFTDKATQGVWFRHFPVSEYAYSVNGNTVTVKTETVEYAIDTNDLSKTSVKIGGKHVPAFNNANLKGTIRTLDNDGTRMLVGGYILDKNARKTIRLCDGVISKKGVAVLDDSKSLLLGEDGSMFERPKTEDYYVFAYGKDYRAAVNAFYAVSGKTPIVPRYALGNWWSRYHAYTQDEYIALMEEFRGKEVPITVATVDMDWHYVDVDKAFGITKQGLTDKEKYGVNGGWTGYTWNKTLFPDHRAFLKRLKSMDLKVTLNLHPADGVRWWESAYGEFARNMGVDPETKQCIPFDFTDDNFVKNYFELLHHPYEREGVDFWWIDWQQGYDTKVKNLDPLWLLNHEHYYDNAQGKTGLILSRYCGAGAHRYPLGFSGDTSICWETLDYMPYFTATASNIGYTWWSHDIGGHQCGGKYDELMIRWVQFGVFSPIHRLHSAGYHVVGKEPWKYSGGTELLIEKYMKFRHRMIPYLYTASRKTNKEGVALIEPMYYTYPNDENAYKAYNQYFFGGELMVVPITTKGDKNGIGKVSAYIPDGYFTDIFNGNVYHGNKVKTIYRETGLIPVLAKEGAIVPLSSDKGNSAANPKALETLVFAGNGTYVMEEDDEKGKLLKTTFAVREQGDLVTLTISCAGDREIAPQVRTFTANFKNVYVGEVVSVTADGKVVDFNTTINQNLKCTFAFENSAEITVKAKLSLRDYAKDPMRYIRAKLLSVLEPINVDNARKEEIYNLLVKTESVEEYLAEAEKCGLTKAQVGMLKELTYIA